MSQRRRSRGHGTLVTAAGSTGPSITAAQVIPLPNHDVGVWGRRRVLLLNSTFEPLAALPARRAVIMLLCGKADVVHDDPSGPVIHSATRAPRRPVRDPPAVLRARAVPGSGTDDARRAHAPRPVPLCVLRRQGRHRRPRGAPQPRWRAFLGELRRRLRGVQPPQGRPPADRTGVGVAVGAAAAQGTALATVVVGKGARPRLGAVSG